MLSPQCTVGQGGGQDTWQVHGGQSQKQPGHSCPATRTATPMPSPRRISWPAWRRNGSIKARLALEPN
eukprot:3087889-Pyramimonas_sp.AAC.1